ncbi:MAG: ABC transporter, partial [Pseudomonadota bacterium]
RPDSTFAVTALINSGNNSWSETSKLEGNVGMDENEDLPGPLPAILALQRTQNGREQRIIISGDGDFLANTYLGNAGNQDFGVRLVEWLVTDKNLIEVPSRLAADNFLSFKKWQVSVIGFGFLLVIPGALVLNGIIVWNKRKRA